MLTKMDICQLELTKLQEEMLRFLFIQTGRSFMFEEFLVDSIVKKQSQNLSKAEKNV